MCDSGVGRRIVFPARRWYLRRDAPSRQQARAVNANAESRVRRIFASRPDPAWSKSPAGERIVDSVEMSVVGQCEVPVSTPGGRSLTNE